MEDSIPFLNSGIDFAGPLHLKEKIKEECTKTYIALFICCSIHACHLELVPELSAETLLLYLWRFMAQRVVPKLINSDNMKTLKTVSNILHKLTRSTKLQTCLSEHRIKVRFNLSLSPWQGETLRENGKGNKTLLMQNTGKSFLNV